MSAAVERCSQGNECGKTVANGANIKNIEKWQEDHKEEHQKIDKRQEKIESTLDEMAKRPTWTVVFIMTLQTTAIGILVTLIVGKG